GLLRRGSHPSGQRRALHCSGGHGRCRDHPAQRLPGGVMVTKRPVLLLDVDGPLNPNKPSEGFVRYVARLGYNRYTVWLNKQHGEWVKALAEETGADLMWASTWNDHANEHIGPRIGLPRLPIVVMSERMLSDEVVERMNA